MIEVKQQDVYLGLYTIEGQYYKELQFDDYKRAPFGEVGWLVHPQVFGINNAKNIIFEKPVNSSWGIISALALFDKEKGSGLVTILPINPIEAGAGNAVVIERGGVFIPVKMLEQVEAKVNSYIIN